jgi:hypothetical protein
MVCPQRWWPSSQISPPGAIADNPSFRIRAQELQQMLANEDGVANVVAAIEVKLIAAGTMELGSAVVQVPISKSG